MHAFNMDSLACYIITLKSHGFMHMKWKASCDFRSYFPSPDKLFTWFISQTIINIYITFVYWWSKHVRNFPDGVSSPLLFHDGQQRRGGKVYFVHTIVKYCDVLGSPCLSEKANHVCGSFLFKDPWPRVLLLPERFVGDPASLARDNIW